MTKSKICLKFHRVTIFANRFIIILSALTIRGTGSHKMIFLLTHDLKVAEQKITELAQKPVRERLAETLIMLKQTYGFEKDNKTIDVTLSREDIANIVGTATESIIRLLADFKQEKLIDLAAKKIVILNLPKLLNIANISD